MRLRTLLFLALLLPVSVCKASTITYNVQGTLQTGSFSGTVLYDNSAQQFTSGTISVLMGTTTSVYTPLFSTGTYGNAAYGFYGNNSNFFTLGISLASLSANPLAGMVCSHTNTCGGYTSGTFTNAAIISVTVGTYAVAGAATPEPSSLALLGTGALGLFGLARRRVA